MTRSARILIAALCVALLAAFWFFLSDGSHHTRTAASVGSGKTESSSEVAETARRSSFVAPNRQIRADRPAVVALPPPPHETDRSPLADKLHDPKRTGVEDLQVVMNLFTHYRSRFQGFPVGEDNAAFMNALTGNNPGRVVIIPRDHPTIDAQGQLLDRWGEPFFFHLLSRDALEIRSAGPDRELYTADDLILDSPEVQKVERTIADR